MAGEVGTNAGDGLDASLLGGGGECGVDFDEVCDESEAGGEGLALVLLSRRRVNGVVQDSLVLFSLISHISRTPNVMPKSSGRKQFS